MENVNVALLGVNAFALSWLLFEIRGLRKWRHEFVNTTMARVNLKAELAIMALRQAGLWKPEYDETLKEN